MSYVNVKTNVKLDPDFFRKEALAFNARSMDRKQWLKKQVINLEYAIYNYQVQIQDLAMEGAKLDGHSDAAKWLQTIGGVGLVIPNIWAKAVGAIVSIAGTIVGAAEKKKDNQALQQVYERAARIQLEAGQIKSYYDNYSAELQRIKLTPLLLFGTAAYLFLK